MKNCMKKATHKNSLSRIVLCWNKRLEDDELDHREHVDEEVDVRRRRPDVDATGLLPYRSLGLAHAELVDAISCNQLHRPERRTGRCQKKWLQVKLLSVLLLQHNFDPSKSLSRIRRMGKIVGSLRAVQTLVRGLRASPATRPHVRSWVPTTSSLPSNSRTPETIWT